MHKLYNLGQIIGFKGLLLGIYNVPNLFKTEYVGETKGLNSREGHLAEALSNLPLNPQEMVKFTPLVGIIAFITYVLCVDKHHKLYADSKLIFGSNA